ASRAKAALSAGVMSSAGLPVHMQRSIHVPDHIVKRCVRLYTSRGDYDGAPFCSTWHLMLSVMFESVITPR
ncbi:MAG: hypothetical protein WCB09_13295, partial [Methylocella sp.]